MILPAAALMDIPAEHRAQSTSLATCCMWEGVRRGRDGGDGREKKIGEKVMKRRGWGEQKCLVSRVLSGHGTEGGESISFDKQEDEVKDQFYSTLHLLSSCLTLTLTLSH